MQNKTVLDQERFIEKLQVNIGYLHIIRYNKNAGVTCFAANLHAGKCADEIAVLEDNIIAIGRGIQLSVFDVVPSNFFSVLVSANREIYVDALLLLHEFVKFELNIRVDDYISALISRQEDRDFTPEDDDELTEGSLTPSGKARLILNRLIKTGWVEKGYIDGSFIEIIIPQPYAIAVMKLLSELGEGGMQEYNSLVFSTYSGLKQAKEEQKDHMYEAILAAKANTEQLEYELRVLYHGIRKYSRDIEAHDEVNSLLKSHFEDYKQMSDRIYHPIKTMDSVHRYMTPIQSILSDALADSTLMHMMCERAIAIQKYADEEAAEREIIHSIDFVMDAYHSLDGMINQIDRKHSTYTKSSIEKMHYLMTADQTIQGKLTRLLTAYASSDEIEKELLLETMEDHIQVNRQEFFDGNSLYHKSVRSRRIDTEPLTIAQDSSFSEFAMQGMVEHLKKGYPIARVRSFVDKLFETGQDTVKSSDIPIEDESDFILLILAVVRANDRGMNYTIEMGDGQIDVGEYRIPNMIFRKKEGKHRVDRGV